MRPSDSSLIYMQSAKKDGNCIINGYKLLLAGFIAVIAAVLLMSLLKYINNTPESVAYHASEGKEKQPIARNAIFGTGSVDPNTADAETLITIPGIGPQTANAIIEERERHGLFYFPEDLMHVRGIGEKKMAAFKEYFTFGSEDSSCE